MHIIFVLFILILMHKISLTLIVIATLHNLAYIRYRLATFSTLRSSIMLFSLRVQINKHKLKLIELNSLN